MYIVFKDQSTIAPLSIQSGASTHSSTKIPIPFISELFIDDSPKNIRAVDGLKRKYPNIKIVTKLAK